MRCPVQNRHLIAVSLELTHAGWIGWTKRTTQLDMNDINLSVLKSHEILMDFALAVLERVLLTVFLFADQVTYGELENKHTLHVKHVWKGNRWKTELQHCFPSWLVLIQTHLCLWLYYQLFDLSINISNSVRYRPAYVNPSLSWRHLKTTNKGAKSDSLQPVCRLFRTGTWKDFHQNA